jgi:hypothetical protein
MDVAYTLLAMPGMAMAASLRELVTGVSWDVLRQRAACILGRIDQHRVREPGEDDE